MFGCISLKAYAKINLCLDVIGTRQDGYHLIESIMQSVGIYDKVKICRTRKNNIEVSCAALSIPQEKNIAHKAAKAFFDAAGITNAGVKIKIEKKIPSQAGMGGGSADAAAVLVGLNRLFKINFSKEMLCEIGAKVGADVPFCICGGTMLVRGIGEILTKLEDCADCYIVVAKGSDGVSTKEAYDAIDNAKNLVSPRVEKLIDVITKGDFDSLEGKLVNVFQQCTEIKDVDEIIKKLRNFGAIDAAMTGSGSAVFGIFKDKKAAKKCALALDGEYPFACLTRPSPFGVD